jgi:hypothetical protein
LVDALWIRRQVASRRGDRFGVVTGARVSASQLGHRILGERPGRRAREASRESLGRFVMRPLRGLDSPKHELRECRARIVRMLLQELAQRARRAIEIAASASAVRAFQ